MTIATTPSILKTAFFDEYLPKAYWLSLLIASLVTGFVVVRFGANIPDVPSMRIGRMRENRSNLVLIAAPDIALSKTSASFFETALAAVA